MSKLTKGQQQHIIELLENEEELPIDYKHLLFPPERQEYELVYAGKDREEDIIADTMAVPLQPIRSFGTNGGDWHNKLIFGDNLQAMKTLLNMKEDGKLCNTDGSKGVRLIYIDPPFATKQDFSRSVDSIAAYTDKLVGAQFIEFLRKRFVLMRELLSEDGFLIVHIDYRYGHYVKIVLDEIFGGNFRNDIKIPRGTKNVQSQFKEISSLTTGDDSLLLYAKNSHAKFKPLKVELKKTAGGKWDTFWRGTDRPTMRYTIFGQKPDTGQWRWKKSRAFESKENYEIYLDKFSAKETLDEYYIRNFERGDDLDFVRQSDDNVVQYFVPPRDTRIANTVWTDVRTLGKVTSYPTEKHEALLFRIISWLTNPGDLVMDAFAGSGTTCASSEKLGRRWISIDCGKLSIYTIQKRILNLSSDIGNKGEDIDPKAFTLYNAGLYDFSKLKNLEWQDWRFFALSLFECRDDPHKIKG